MGQILNNLFLFNLDTERSYIDMWHELDKDFSEDNYVRDSTTLKGYAYKSKAEKIIKELLKDDWNDCDYSRVEFVMNLIKKGHGSFSSQFEYIITETENHEFNVAVSYLT